MGVNLTLESIYMEQKRKFKTQSVQIFIYIYIYPFDISWYFEPFELQRAAANSKKCKSVKKYRQPNYLQDEKNNKLIEKKDEKAVNSTKKIPYAHVKNDS